eukprot:SM000079S22467  [mRNA]  locus=s79:344177:345737:- [translate_table: standard]
MSHQSELLLDAHRRALCCALPAIAIGREWVLLYSSQRHGISLATMYRRSQMLAGPSLLVVGDKRGAVFGGLLSTVLKPSSRKKYLGSSDSFVFTDVTGKLELFLSTGPSVQPFAATEALYDSFAPSVTATRLQVLAAWLSMLLACAGINRYFVLCLTDTLALGGGGHFAIQLDGDLTTGTSGPCETYGSPCLAHDEDYIVKNVELWGFAHASRYSPRQAAWHEPTQAPGLHGW